MLNIKQRISWAKIYLNNVGYTVLDKEVLIKKDPWAIVIMLPTARGKVFLKIMAQAFINEPNIIQSIAAFSPKHLPKIIEINQKLSCFLMEDSGSPLRNYFKNNKDFKILNQALKDYGQVQIDILKNINKIQSFNLLNLNFTNFAQEYSTLINKKNFLLKEGISIEQINDLHLLSQRVKELCQELNKNKISAVIEHGDFLDNNILIKETDLVINDWAESVFAHPFFSLVTFLYSLERNHGIKKGTFEYKRLKNTYLNSWIDYDNIDNLEETYQLIKLLSPIKGAIAFERLSRCSHSKKMEQYKGRAGRYLNTFLNKNKLILKN